MKINNIYFKNGIVLASMAGITNSDFAINNASDAGLVIIGSYNIDSESINSGLLSNNEGRDEFIYENPIQKITEEIQLFEKKFIEKYGKNKETPKLCISIRCKSINKLIELLEVIENKNVILEIDCHCRQKSFLDAGLGEALINNKKLLLKIISCIKERKILLSIKIRPLSIINIYDFINFINNTNVDIIHIDAMSKNIEKGNENYIKTFKNNIKNKIIIANNSVKSFDDCIKYFSCGADLVSVARNVLIDKNIIKTLSTDFDNHIKIYGWYNSPSHICKNGDLRGLSFCCPAIKNCKLISTLNQYNISKDEYHQLKIKYSKNTPLQLNVNTCFGSLLWCCKISKPCVYRDQALININLSKKDYMLYKKNIGDKIILDIYNKNH